MTDATTARAPVNAGLHVAPMTAVDAERWLRRCVCSHEKAVDGCVPCARTTAAIEALRADAR